MSAYSTRSYMEHVINQVLIVLVGDPVRVVPIVLTIKTNVLLQQNKKFYINIFYFANNLENEPIV
jgi:hypothetical protein